MKGKQTPYLSQKTTILCSYFMYNILVVLFGSIILLYFTFFFFFSSCQQKYDKELVITGYSLQAVIFFFQCLFHI